MQHRIGDKINEFTMVASINRYLKKAKTSVTQKNWKYSLYDFFEFIKMHPDEFIKLDRNTIEDVIESYVDHIKERVQQNEVSPNSVETMVVPLKKFLIFNRVDGVTDVWIRIKANFPAKKRSSDEKYSEIELQKMYSIANYREKCTMGLLMSGMRIGGVVGLAVSDLKPIEDWAAVRVYGNTTSEYHAFVTPQGYRDIVAYLEYRKRNGEEITRNTPLLRNDFRPECAGGWIDGNGTKRGGPMSIRTSNGASSIIITLVRKAGISVNSHDHKNRHKTMTCHGFRKYFNTVCKTSGMDSERVEMLMGHANSSLSGHYWRLPIDETGMSPQEQTMFQTVKKEFRRCIPELTVGESEILKIKNQQLEGTLHEQMKEKEFQIVMLQRQLAKIKESPFFGMSPEDMEGQMQMYQDYKNLKLNLPNMSTT